MSSLMLIFLDCIPSFWRRPFFFFSPKFCLSTAVLSRNAVLSSSWTLVRIAVEVCIICVLATVWLLCLKTQDFMWCLKNLSCKYCWVQTLTEVKYSFLLFELSIYQKILKINIHPTKYKAVAHFDNNKKYFSAANQHIRKISEGSCDILK